MVALFTDILAHRRPVPRHALASKQGMLCFPLLSRLLPETHFMEAGANQQLPPEAGAQDVKASALWRGNRPFVLDGP